MQTIKLLGAALICAWILGFAPPVLAADSTDLSVGLKTLPLLTEKMSGAVVVAVVFDPAKPNSKAEAESIKAMIDSGMEPPGGIKLTATLVSSNEGHKMAGAKIVYIAQGSCSDAVAATATAGGMLTISTDIDCVKAGKCIIGVVSKPNIEIYYSKAASDAAKIGFSQAFSMLVKQV